MGTLLRYSSCRLSKLIAQSAQHKNEWTRSRSYFPRYFSTDKFTEGEAASKEGMLPQTKEVDGDASDLIKFKNINKISLPQSTVKSDDFALGPQSDANTFGTLSPSNPYLTSIQEGTEEDQTEDKYISELPNYLPQKEYVDMIKKHLNQRRFADALNVLQVTMLKEHRVKPEYYVYAILISYCGMTGYSKMAVKLYNEMKRRGLKITSSVYTSLFNSFANSPYPTDGLKRTRHLLSLMHEKGNLPNEINCHAIIKAFGRCGSVEEAFKVVDYMMNRKLRLNPDAMSFLFHACISDKEAGFRHALLVYKKMMEYKMKPDVIHFNLILHCLRDCSMGDITSVINVLKRIGVPNADTLVEIKEEPISLPAGYAWEEDDKLSAAIVTGAAQPSTLQSVQAQSSDLNASSIVLPNLFSHPPTLGCIVSVSEIVKPQDRLMLLGGIEGFLMEMSKHNAKPDIKTINFLLECCPQTCTAEETVLKIGAKLGVKFDLLYFNSLIRRRCYRQQYSEAKEVLPLITAHGFQPDLMTYTNLAMACRKIEDAYQLLKAVDESNMRPGIELVTSLFGVANCDYQMRYVQLVFDVIDYEEMKVNSIFLKKTDDFYAKCQRVLKIRPPKFHIKTLEAIEKFCKRYPHWKQTVEVEEVQHPWQHLREKHTSDSETDQEFFSQHVEKERLKHKFSRLGPTALPKVKQAIVKKLKEEDPDWKPDRRQQKRKETQKLEGISSVTYQKLLPKQM